MRKYRLTKITVKIREIISRSKDTADSNCPVCHQPIPPLKPAAESSNALPETKRLKVEMPLAETSGD